MRNLIANAFVFLFVATSLAACRAAGSAETLMVETPVIDSPQRILVETVIEPTEDAASEMPVLDIDNWVRYENPTLGLTLRHPADWGVTGRGNGGITLTAPQTVTVESETVPWIVRVTVREKYAEDASLFDVIVNDYHFEPVIEQFEETLTEKTINGRTAYHSTIIQASIGGQLSVFFEDGDRFVEVMLRPFNEERPYENQEAFAELFTMLLESVEFTEEVADVLADPTEHLSFSQPILPLADYPPSDTPYRIEQGDFWLVHTPEGQIMAFSPLPPDYAGRVAVEECEFAWVEANQRFTDPCSGDEWELNGRLNLEHSTELWSNRDLDQYYVGVMDGRIFVQFTDLLKGLSINEPPLATDAQFGVTMTVATAEFSLTATALDLMVQVDPIWGLDSSAFPPQQALRYPTFPDSLVDDQGHAIAPSAGQGGFAAFDSQTGGLRQGAPMYWEPVVPDTQAVTATLTVDLSSIYREIILPIEWADYEAGDTWTVAIPIEIGYAAAQITQIEWINMTPDGRMRLRLTVTDDSPEGINLYCLHLDTTDPWQQTCANFDRELDYIIISPAEEPVSLHLRAGLAFTTSFQLVLDVE